MDLRTCHCGFACPAVAAVAAAGRIPHARAWARASPRHTFGLARYGSRRRPDSGRHAVIHRAACMDLWRVGTSSFSQCHCLPEEAQSLKGASEPLLFTSFFGDFHLDIHHTLIECAGGTVALPAQPMNHRSDGGHLLVNPPRPVWERTELTPRELALWGCLVAATAKAMLETLPQLSGGCLN